MKSAERAVAPATFDWEQIKARLPLALQLDESPEELSRLFRRRPAALPRVATDAASSDF